MKIIDKKKLKKFFEENNIIYETALPTNKIGEKITQ
jgi:hypothetical protein